MIREARVEDLPAMETAAGEFYRASRFLQDFEIKRFIAAWTQLIESGAGVIFVLAGGDGIAGAIGGVAYPEINSGTLVASEFFWFVRPGHRGGGMALYRRFEQWARARRCAQIQMVHMVDSMPEKLDKVYRYLGFEPAEVRYVKEIR